MSIRWIKGFNRQRSYYKWGLLELQKRIDSMCEVGYTEHEVIEMFIHEMDRYACMNKNTSIMFSCAADAGRYVLEGYIATYI